MPNKQEFTNYDAVNYIFYLEEMNIALVSQEYPPETSKGGIGTQTFSKAKGLSALGHKVFVLSRSIDENRHESTNGLLTVIRIPGFENYIYEMTDIVQWITYSALVSAELETLHQQVGLDIIDFPEWGAEGYVYLLNRTPWKTVATVIQLHGPLVMFGPTMNWPNMNSQFYKVGTHMEATCVQLADAVYSSSQCSSKWIRQHYDQTRTNIPVIHTGVNTKSFTPRRRIENDTLKIIFIGKLVSNKGVNELVEATCQLSKDFTDLQLLLIGIGDKAFIEKLQSKARENGSTNMLKFYGFINKEDLPLLLSEGDVFAAPSYYEGGPGFVYLEAMSCGLPVIACSGSGIEEIVTSGENGILVPPRDVNALVKALRTILSNKTLRKNMAAKARNYVMKNADTDVCLKKLESFYTSVIRAKSMKKEEMEYG